MERNKSRVEHLTSTGPNGKSRIRPARSLSPAQEIFYKSLSDPAFFRYGGLSGAADVEPLRDPFSQVAAVYACIMARARPLGMCPIKAYVKDSEGSYEEVKSSPFDRIIYRPNPLLSRYQLIETWEASICRHGNFFLFLDRKTPNAIPSFIWPLDPTKVEPVLDSRNLPVAWKYRPGGSTETKVYQPFQIAHDKITDPDNPVLGISPLRAAHLDITQEWDVTRWNRSFLENNCEPGGRYELREGGSMDPEQVNAVLRNHKQKVAGPSRVGEPMMDMGGLAWKPYDIPHQDMSFETQREFNLRAIKMCLGVPTVALGFEEDIPYAGAKAQMRMFWTNTLIPRCRSIEDVLWASLCESVEGGKYEILFDLQAVEALRDDITEKIAAVAPLWNAGVPMSEINRALGLGLEEYEGWEDRYVPIAAPFGGPVAASAHRATGLEEKERVELVEFTPEEIDEAKSWDSAVLRPHERKFQGKMRSFFFEHRNAVLRRFAEITGYEKSGPEGEQKADDDRPATPFDPDTLFPDENELTQKLTQALEPIYRQAILDGAAFGANLIGTEAQVTQLRGDLARWMARECLGKITGIEDTLRDELRRSLSEGIEAGETLVDLAARIKQIHRNAQARSMTIARTEVGRAANHGEHEEFKESGIVTATRWNAAMDGATRESHRRLHRQTVPLGQPFVSPVTGASLMYPGDPGGPPEEVINCRCVARPVLSE